MRSHFLPAMLAVAVLVLPELGDAAPGPFRWPAKYAPLEGRTEAVTSSAPIDLGFDFQFYGQTFNQVRISTKGNLTLGYADPKGIDDIPADDPDQPSQGEPPDLGASGAPANMIALWWGHHVCQTPDFGVRFQRSGLAPHRYFVVEWTCTEPSEDWGFRGQIRLLENSSIVQLAYDTIKANPRKSDHNPDADWVAVRAGIRNQDGTQFSNALAECTGGVCRKAQFPAGTVIQYGVWLDMPSWGNDNNTFDVIAEIDESSIRSGVDDPTGPSPTAWVEFDGVLRNISEVASPQPVTYVVYLADRPGSRKGGVASVIVVLRPEEPQGQGSPLEGWPDPNSVIPIVPVGGATRFEQANIPAGQFHVCVEAETWAKENSRATAQLRNHPDNKPANNWICSKNRIQFGPDLTAEILDAPNEMKVLDPFTVRVRIKNIGNMQAIVEDDPITFDLVAAAEDNVNAKPAKLVPSDARHVLDLDLSGAPFDAYVGKVTTTLDPGAEATVTALVMFPFISNSNASSYRIQATVASSWMVGLGQQDDANPSNNTGVAGKATKFLAPSYAVASGEGKFDMQMPMGCVLGEPVRGRFEVCNQGDVEGFGFRPEVRLKVGEGRNEMDEENGIIATLLPSCVGNQEPALDDNGNPIPDKRKQIDDPTMCAEGEVCSLGNCWKPCDPEDNQPNNGCPSGFKCLFNPMVTVWHSNVDYTCMPYLEPKQCHSYPYVGALPTEEIYFESDMTKPPHPLIPDHSLVMPFVMGNPHSAPAVGSVEFADLAEEYMICQWARPDLVADNVKLVIDVEAGKPIDVERRFRNLGSLSTEFEYGYYLSTIPNVSALQWLVPIVGSPDGLGRSRIDGKTVKEDWTTADGVDQRTDLIRIPETTPPGEYYFGVVADPRAVLEELDENNNIVALPYKVRVHAPTLRIETPSLAQGTVGVRYNLTLWASGGVGQYSWEKVEGFPAWLDLDSRTGHLSGVPTEARDYVLTVKVRSGYSEFKKTFALTVLEPEGRLTIPKHVFPVAVTRQVYGPVELKANGGLPPYTWKTTNLDGTGTGMPPGFCSRDGIIRSGHCDSDNADDTVPNIDPGAYRFLAHVTDSRGATDVEELVLYVAGPSALQIRTEILPALQVGLRADTCISADGGNPDNYVWTVTGLPRGLAANPNDLNQVCIQGVPTQFGAFTVNVTVSDEGMQASRMFTLQVVNRDVILARSHLGEFPQGATVEERLETNFPAQIRIIQGRLPSGLELTADNWIRGVISRSAEPGNYPVLLELRNEDGMVSPAGLGITVVKMADEGEQQTDDEGGGCGSSATGSNSGTGLGLAAVMLGLMASLRSRRRAAESN